MHEISRKSGKLRIDARGLPRAWSAHMMGEATIGLGKPMNRSRRITKFERAWAAAGGLAVLALLPWPERGEGRGRRSL